MGVQGKHTYFIIGDRDTKAKTKSKRPVETHRSGRRAVLPSRGKRLRKGPATFKPPLPCPEGYDHTLYRTLTLTQRKFVRAYFTNGFREKEAGLAAGLEDGPGIYAQSSRMLRDVKIGMDWEQIFEARGITDSKLADVVVGSLEAESAVVTADCEYNDNGKLASRTEKITYVLDASAHRTRLEGAKTMGKWKGREKTVLQGDPKAPPIQWHDPNLTKAITQWRRDKGK